MSLFGLFNNKMNYNILDSYKSISIERIMIISIELVAFQDFYNSFSIYND